MTRAKLILLAPILLVGPGACNSESDRQSTAAIDIETTAPVVDYKTADDDLGGATVTPGAPYRISYRIVGTPVVGVPVTVDLSIESLRGSRPVNLDYRLGDSAALLLGDSQPASVSLEPAANETVFRQQVIVVPQREGRFYLNVAASFDTEDGTMSTITAIPVQVGSGSRELQDNGSLDTDESGEPIRVLGDDG